MGEIESLAEVRPAEVCLAEARSTKHRIAEIRQADLASSFDRVLIGATDRGALE